MLHFEVRLSLAEAGFIWTLWEDLVQLGLFFFFFNLANGDAFASIELEGTYSSSGFIYFLKGCDLHFCSLSPFTLLSQKCKTHGESGPGFGGRFSNAALICVTGGSPQSFPPGPTACRVMDYLPLSRLHGRCSQWFMHSGRKTLPADGRILPVFPSRGPRGLNLAGSVNPMCYKEKIKGTFGTKWLFQSFQLV